MKRLSTVALTGCALALAGCAAVSASASAGTSPSGGSGATRLIVTVDSGPGTSAKTYTLTCDPAGGTHPDPAAACAALAAVSRPFAADPADQACTEQYGGPQRATVTGTYRGDTVAASFSRTNGCGISRWDALVALLVARGGA